jgi:ribosomal protein S18 acetylase RimI-like enzyme
MPAPQDMQTLTILRADYANAGHAQAVVDLLDAYARDPAGGGHALESFTRDHLIASLAALPQAFSCLEGFSTFACRPLVNIHDLAVLPSHRGRRVAEQMLQLVEQIARERKACKLTLEVLSGNHSANRLYSRVGFGAYQLDPAMGQASFLQKWLD